MLKAYMLSKLDLECIAAAAHMANRAYCLGIGDPSQPTWADAPDWQRESAVNGVRACIDGGPDYSPEASHKSWLAQKDAEGWTYGPTKDPEKKQHPCMVDYCMLPEAQRAKDHLFLATVRTLAKLMEGRRSFQ